MTWDNQVVENIDAIIPNEFSSEVIYVSDCAMVTGDTSGKANSNGLKFIFRMAAKFKLVGELGKTAQTDEKPWIQMGKLSLDGKRRHPIEIPGKG